MTYKLKIAFLIPTYNRLEKLKFALQKIEAQEIDDRFELFCVISNIASNDGTFEFLNQIKSNKIQYVIWNKPEQNLYEQNWRRAVEAVPKDINWVWLHGDDDYVKHDKVVSNLVNVISNNQSDNLTLVHACQASRSRMSGRILIATVWDLVNQIGYHELLGWMSSLVVRRDKFMSALLWATEPGKLIKKPEDYLSNKISSYRHSAGLLRHTLNDLALFVDSAWIDAQDQVQTPQTIERWAEGFFAERYFFVVDDILAMYAEKILTKPLNPIFFRYLNFSLWDRYASNILDAVLQTGQIHPFILDHLNRIKQIADNFSSTRDKKLYYQWHSNLLENIRNFVVISQVFNDAKNELNKQAQFCLEMSYPLQILDDDSEF